MSRKLVLGALAALVTIGSTASFAENFRLHREGRFFNRDVCEISVGRAMAHCHARVLTDGRGDEIDARPNRGSRNATTLPSGYGPADLRSAYNLGAFSTATPTGPWVAVVDAYGYTNAEADLAVYRQTYGLPACTTANGCFKKVDQNGGTKYPRDNTGWSQETALDLDMVSAACPNCRILLVEANSNSLDNLGAAVNRAAAMGAVAISNSYGASEFNGEAGYESQYYQHPGIAVTVSSGDNGYGVEFPAASQYVTAVGGTSLTRSGSGWSETAWSGAGSGCSAYISKPSWQADGGCTNRTVADVSAVADPNTGVAVYGPKTRRGAGWMIFGGTSASAPLIAAIYASNGGTATYGSDPYNNPGGLRDVTSGSNGTCSTYLCKAVTGYDGPTGLGTPNGTSSF
jgi:subtilase family serine protease